MLFNIYYSDQFFEDLDGIIFYYSSFINENFLINFHNFIMGSIDTLNILPGRCKIIDFHNQVRLFLIEGKYKIYYKVNDLKKEVYILRISLTSQNDVNFF